MSIYVVTGEPGAGKSALGYVLAGKHCKNDKRQVLATYDMDWYNVKTTQWAEMARAENAVCIVDESASLWHARSYSEKGRVNELEKFREHRKDGLTLYLIVQDFATLDTNIREMTRFVWHVKRLFGPDFYENATKFEETWGVWSLARLYLAKNYLTASKKFWKSSQPFRLDRLFGRFDTLAKSSGKTSTEVKRGAGLAQARRTRHEAARLGDLRPKVLMPFSREEYDLHRNLVGSPNSLSGRVEWRDGRALELVSMLNELGEEDRKTA